MPEPFGPCVADSYTVNSSYAVTILSVAFIGPPGALAQVTTTNHANPQPYIALTPEDRWHLYLRDVANPLALVASNASAGINQWRDVPFEWGQGGSGFGRRLASSYSNHLVDSTLLFGASSLLHEDNRYIRSNLQGTGRRMRYAVLSTFLARRDNGTRKVSISRIGAFGATALISRAWQPESTASPQSAASSFAISIAVSTGFHVAQEFLPALFHRK
jgi:hypothetical protein